ncbi:MAG: hypothetical protein GX993_03880 [Bacteroidales bacterium]|nr:hypothetical protein [Bacteroidales bacterium]
MKFRVSRRIVREGDIVEVKWECPEAESAQITINNGYRVASATVPPSGSKKYKLNRSKGRTRITLFANCHGTPVRREISIVVRRSRSPRIKADKNVYDSYTRIDKPGFRQRFRIFRDRLSYIWQCMPAQKKLAYTLLWILFAAMLLIAFIPKLTYFALFAIAIYLFWYIYKK